MTKVKNKGITLIALIITIIILLILAGVSIAFLKQDGIIAKSKWTAYVTEYETVDEGKKLYVNEQIINKYAKVATTENVSSTFTSTEEIIYPVSEKVEIEDIESTLKNTIISIEGVTENDLKNINIVNLYKIDLEEIGVKAKKEYVVNIVSGQLYSLQGEEYNGKIYHTPRLGVAQYEKMTEVGTYEMIIDAGQIVSWDSIEIFYDKYVENSLTCKIYTSDDEITWKEGSIEKDTTLESEEKYKVTDAEKTQYLKVEIKIEAVNGKNSEVEYLLVNFYKYRETDIEPEVTVEGAEKTGEIWGIETSSNGETEAKGTATVTQTVTIPEEGEYILDIEIYGKPSIVVTITKPDGTTETIEVEDETELRNIPITGGSTVEIETTLSAGDGIGQVKVLEKENTLTTEKIEQVKETESSTNWVTVEEKKYMYNNGGTGYWMQCFVDEKEVDETGIIIEDETAVRRIKVAYQTSTDGKSWSNKFTNIQDAANMQYLKVIVDYQVIEGNEYGDTSNSKVKVILNDGSWLATFKNEDGTVLFTKRVYFTSSAQTATLTIPDAEEKDGKILAYWTTEEGNTTIGTSYTMTKDTEFIGFYINQDIYTVEDLVAFRDAVNTGAKFEGKTINLMNDLDLSSICGEDVGSWEPIGATGTYFTGTFDGNYNTISNLYINSHEYLYAAFVTKTTENTIIRNVVMENLYINNSYNGTAISAGIVGINVGHISDVGINSGIISVNNSYNNGSWESIGAAGIAGQIEQNSIITNCYNKASIIVNGSTKNYAQAYAGGIVGGSYSLGHYSISNCYNMGNINLTSYQAMVGGIIGSASLQSTALRETVIVENVYNTGTITINGTNKYYGGIVGRNGYSSTRYYINMSNFYYTTPSIAQYYYSGGFKTSTSGKVEEDTLRNSSIILGDGWDNDVLSDNGTSYKYNEGYPILKWQIQE